MCSHEKYRNIEIASVDLDKKIISLIVHYNGEEADLIRDDVQAKLNLDVATALAHFKNERYFEDDTLDHWRVLCAVMIHPPINHE